MKVTDQASDVDGGRLSDARRSIFAHIEQGLLDHAARPAVICMHQPAELVSQLIDNEHESHQGNQPEGCLVLTYDQLHQAAVRLCAGLLANGIRPGSTIIMMIENGAEWAILMWCCSILKVTLAAVDASVLDSSKRLELLDNLNELKPDAVIVEGPTKAVAFEAAVENTNKLPALRFCLGHERKPAGWKTFPDVLSDGRATPIVETTLLEAARDDDGERTHSILFTSGTSSGRPKGCPLTVAGMCHVLESQSWLINPENCELVLQQAHNSRAIGERHVLQTWRDGGAVVLATGQSFAIAHTIEAILKYRVTFLVLSPAMVHALAQKLPAHDKSRNSVKSIQVGGDAVTKEVLSRCATLFPKAKVFINHGMSEGGGFFQWPYFDTPTEQIPCLIDICPTGAVAPGTRVRIYDEQQHTATPRGEAGRLHVSCGSIIPQYLGGVDASSFFKDGETRWFDTGDVATMNSQGVVYILGRAKDAVDRAGKIMMPAVLESCIESYAGVQVSVVTVPGRKHDPEVYAVLAGLTGTSESQIIEHVWKTLGESYRLEGAVSLQQIGMAEFPVNATHKVIKYKVQQAVSAFVNGRSG